VREHTHLEHPPKDPHPTRTTARPSNPSGSVRPLAADRLPERPEEAHTHQLQPECERANVPGRQRVSLPWLAFGHIIPFLELSEQLANRGHFVNFVCAPSPRGTSAPRQAEASPP
jgi:hypothetical protein